MLVNCWCWWALRKARPCSTVARLRKNATTEFDLIRCKGNAGTVGSLIQPSLRLLILVHLHGPKKGSTALVPDAFTKKLRLIALQIRQSLNYD